METWSSDEEVALTDMANKYPWSTEIVEASGFNVYYRFEVVVTNKVGEVFVKPAS